MEDKKKGALGLAVNSPVERVLNGLIVENPTLVLLIAVAFWMNRRRGKRRKKAASSPAPPP